MSAFARTRRTLGLQPLPSAEYDPRDHGSVSQRDTSDAVGAGEAAGAARSGTSRRRLRLAADAAVSARKLRRCMRELCHARCHRDVQNHPRLVVSVGNRHRSKSKSAGAPEGTRTPNLLIRSQMLYPLSYGRPAARPTGSVPARESCLCPGCWGHSDPTNVTYPCGTV